MTAHSIPDPEVLRGAARRLRLAADDLSLALELFRGRIEASRERWQAPVADRFRSTASSDAGRGAQLADAYRQEAGWLDALAGQANHARTFLGGLERRVREAITEYERLGLPLPINPQLLPGPFDWQW